MILERGCIYVKIYLSYLLYKEFLYTKKNVDAYNRDMQLIEEHPYMKQIYQKRS